MSDLPHQKILAREIVKKAFTILAESSDEQNKLQEMLNLGVNKRDNTFTSQGVIGEIQKTIKRNLPQDKSFSLSATAEAETSLPPNQLQDQDLYQTYTDMDIDTKQRSKNEASEEEKEESSSDEEYKGEVSDKASSASSEEEKNSDDDKDSRHGSSGEEEEKRGRSSSSESERDSKKSKHKRDDNKNRSKHRRHSSDGEKKDSKHRRDSSGDERKKKHKHRRDSSGDEKKKRKSKHRDDSSEEEEKKKKEESKKSEKRAPMGETPQKKEPDAKGKKHKESEDEKNGGEESEGASKKKVRSPYVIIRTIADISERVPNIKAVRDEYDLDDDDMDEILDKCLTTMSKSRFRKDKVGRMQRWKAEIDAERNKWFKFLHFTSEKIREMEIKDIGNIMYNIIDECTSAVEKEKGITPTPVEAKRKRQEDKGEEPKETKKQKSSEKEKRPAPKREDGKAAKLADMSKTEQEKTVAELMTLFNICAVQLTMLKIDPNWHKLINEKSKAKETSEVAKNALAMDIVAYTAIRKDMQFMARNFVEQVARYAPNNADWKQFSVEVTAFTKHIQGCSFTNATSDGILCCITKKKYNKDQIFKVKLSILNEKKEIIHVTRFMCKKWKDILHAFYFVFLQKDIMTAHGIDMLESDYKGEKIPALMCSFLLNNDKETAKIFESVRIAYNRLYAEMDDELREKTLLGTSLGWF